MQLTTFANYRIKDVLGMGGVAIVYHAVDETSQREVALKVLQTRRAADSIETRRFEREARIVQRLRHPHIIEIYEYGQFEGKAYLAMEYMSGGSLAEHFRDPLPLLLGEAIDILMPIAAALDYAHSEGVVHRDLKLDNVLIDGSGLLKLSDFGLARILDFSRITTSGHTFGTPLYMSPEQAQGLKNTDFHSDCYSLAVMAYLLATGYFPFAGSDALEVMKQHVWGTPPPPSNLNPRLPPQLDSVLLKGLSKNPQERFASAGALLEAFKNSVARHTEVEIVVLTSMPTPIVSNNPLSIPTPDSHIPGDSNTVALSIDFPRRRRPWMGIATGAVIALLILGLFQVIRLVTTPGAIEATNPPTLEAASSTQELLGVLPTATHTPTNDSNATNTVRPTLTRQATTVSPSATHTATRLPTLAPSSTATIVPPSPIPVTPVPTDIPATPVPATPVPPTAEPVIDLPIPTVPVVSTLLPGLIG